VAAVKRLRLGDRGNAGTPLGRATRRHENEAGLALQEFLLVQAMGGWSDYLSVPAPKLHQFLLVMAGMAEAEQQQAKDMESKSKGGSSEGVGGAGWRQRNKTTGEWEG
jgi:hypothetical protein